MPSRVSQYVDEVHTCHRMGASPLAFLTLVKRTGEFHLNNLLKRRGAGSTTAAEKHRVMLGNRQRDLWLRPGTGDLFIFHEIFTNECYRIPKTILPRARTIVDLGANIGLTTLYLSEAFPEAKYVCVEPNPFNAAILQRNVAWLGDRVSVIESAMADHDGEVSFADSDWSWGGHIASGEAVSRKVPCVTLESIMRAERLSTIDLLKVDIEGAEELVFSSRPEWLRNVGCIVIELHGQYSFSRFEQDLSVFGLTAIPEGSLAGNPMNMAVSNHRNWSGSPDNESMLAAGL